MPEMEGFRRRKVVLRLGLGLILLVLLVWVIDLGWNAAQLWRVVQDGRALAQSGLQNASLDQLSALGTRAYPPLRAVRRDVRPVYPVLRLVQGLPRLGPLLGQVEPGLEAGTELAHAGVTLLPLLQPVWEDAPTADGSGRLERLVQGIALDQKAAAAALGAVERAAPYVQRLNPQHIPESFRDNVLQLQDNFPLILAGARLLPAVPGLLGASSPQTYLVLAQNNDELRPTGGFISAIGEIRLERGAVAAFNLPDSYSIDNPAVHYPLPPWPLQNYMRSGLWLARDANWSPDFPTAAQQVQALYTLSTGREVNGVLAFDQSAIQVLVAALGQVAVGGYDEPITAQNVIYAMRSAWNPGDGLPAYNQWYTNRKNFISDMGKAILSETLAMRNPGLVQSVLGALLNSLRTGHLQVYINDPVIQSQLAGLELDGGVRPTPGDFLMLVDWNFGFNKVDPLIQRSLVYEVDFSDPRQPHATLTVRYLHSLQEPVACRHEAAYGQEYEDLQRRCFWNYWRVYAAPGSQLTSVVAPPLPGQYLLSQQDWDGRLDVLSGEGGAQVFGGPLMLPAAGLGEIVLNYQLPAGILAGEAGGLVYRLRLQKQAGLVELPVQVRVTAPAGYRAEALNAAWFNDAGTAVWQASLQTTQAIALRFTPLE
jgi:hypothetical protein